MELKKAFRMLRDNRGKSLKFWFCAEGADNAPVLLLDPKSISSTERKRLMKTAKRRQFASGVVLLTTENVLETVPNGGLPGNFAKAVRDIASAAGAKISKVVIKEAVAETAPAADEVKRKALGAQYAGEDKKSGWRADNLAPGTDPAEREAYREGDRVTTRYFDSEEKRKSGVDVGGDGLLRDADGDLKDGKEGFVVDPETGKLHTFEGGFEDVGDGKKKATHHSSPLAGGDVAGAGHIKTEGGRVKSIDDASGHYKPGGDLTYQMVQKLEAAAAKLVDTSLKSIKKTWGDSKEASAKLQESYRIVQLYERERATLGKDVGPYSSEMQQLKDVLLAKGVGPANKPAKVKLQGKYGITADEWKDVQGNEGAINALLERKYGFEDLLQGLTDRALNSHAQINLTIGEKSRLVLTKDQYLQTGGNEQQARRKSSLNKEIEKHPRTIAGQEKLEKKRRLAEKQARQEEAERLVEARLQELGYATEFEALRGLGVSDYALDSGFVQRKDQLRIILGKMTGADWNLKNHFK